ncbi:MAG: hypothetical protein ABIP17_17085 [Ilumatobacteraceae bacterium]
MAPLLRGAAWAVAVALIVVSVVWGRRFQRDSPEIFLGAAPLVGRDFRDGWNWRFGWSLLPAGAGAAWLAWAVLTGWWWRIRIRTLVAVTSIGSAVFGTLLALTDGRDGLTYGVVHRSEYLSNLAITPPTGEFVRTFVERIGDYSVHVRGHPPGFVVLLQAMDAIGLEGVWPVVALSIGATAVLPCAVLIAVWAVAGPEWVRRTAPALIVSPYLIWMVSSADAVYTAVAACAVASVALGLRSVERSATAWGFGGGIVLGVLLFFTYGGAMFLVVPATVVGAGWVQSERGIRADLWRVLVGAIAGSVAVLAAWALAGFWWLDGAIATRQEYWAGSAQFRSFRYFSLGNLAAALIALGPFAFAGVLRLRSRAMWVLVGGGLTALIASDLSRYTLAEVERIWLLFFPWIVIASGSLVVESRRRTAAIWIAIQAGCAIVLQAALVSKW